MIRQLISVVLLMCVAWMPVAQSAELWEPEADYCPVLDAPPRPVFDASVFYAPASDVVGFGETALLEMGGSWHFGYYRDVLRGDVTVRFDGHLRFFTDAASVELPNQVAEFAADIRWATRSGSTGFLVNLEPGVYTDFEEATFENLAMPTTLALVQRFGTGISAVAGATVRLGFKDEVIPYGGVVCELGQTLRLEALVPDGGLTWFPNREWRVTFGYEWHNASYHIREKGPYDREEITLEDIRVGLAVMHRISDDLRLTGEVGRVMERSVKFRESIEVYEIPRDLEIEEAPYFRLTLSGPY